MNQPDYFRKRSQPDQEKTSWILKIGVVAAIVLIAFLAWHSLNDKIWSGVESYLDKSQKDFLVTFNDYLIKSKKNPRELLLLGQKLAPSSLDLAVLVFEDAALKNKDYRDAFLSLGLGYLKQSQVEKNKEKSHQKLVAAKDALERAATIDPIYAYTYQLEQIVYKTLDDTKSFEDAKKHYETVTTISTNPNYSN